MSAPSFSGLSGSLVEQKSSGIERRTIIIGGVASAIAAAAAAAALTADRTAVTTPASERIAPPASLPLRPLSTVVGEAVASAGLRLRGSPWEAALPSANAAWSVAFATWLLRDNEPIEAFTADGVYHHFAERGQVGTEPREGALVFYGFGEPDSIYHVGLVEKMMGGFGLTIEGDVPGALGPTHTFVRRFSRPWDERVHYAYPSYA